MHLRFCVARDRAAWPQHLRAWACSARSPARETCGRLVAVPRAAQAEDRSTAFIQNNRSICGAPVRTTSGAVAPAIARVECDVHACHLVGCLGARLRLEPIVSADDRPMHKHSRSI
uniref:Uncharacterized protein n=1 Tax=Oryza meridionalis TaxID=40149 RepID=A0A0E0FB99_9ORYZ